MKLLKKMQWGLLALVAFVGVNAEAQYVDTSVRDRIYAAASVGNTAELRRLASLGYSLDLVDANGNTAYCQAVWTQNRTAIASLIAAGVDVRPSCLRRIPYVTESRIYAAAHAEDLDQLVAWKKEGLNVDVINPRTGDSALCEAVYNYDCPAIQTLLRVGSQQAQPCMRRVPQEVRERLQCRPLRIDWKTIGYTVLGAGMAGALVAILGSGGGNGNPSCPATQRWNGNKCISCDTCWVGTRCVSRTEMHDKPYYRDETNAECWMVSPPPVKMTDEELLKAVEKIEDDPKYQNGHYLKDIHAAEAYARGYTGYLVERTSPYGRLVHGQVSPGVKPYLTDKKITVAIFSDGMTIGKGGKVSETITSGTSSSKSVDVWNYDGVNKAFYDSLASAAQQYAGASYTPYNAGNNTTTASGTYVSALGAVATNLALDNEDPKVGKPYGFNFDYGECAQSGGEYVNKKNCYYGISKALKNGDGTTPEILPYGLAMFADGNGKAYYILENTDTGQITGLTTVTPIHCQDNTAANCVQNYARWQVAGTSDEHGGAATVDGGILASYTYVAGYTYDANNPTPHYTNGSGSGTYTVGSVGTFMAGIVGAMKLEDPNVVTYGVAPNVSILPVNRDLVRGLSLEAMQKMTSNADVIVSSEATGINESLSWETTTVLGGFTKEGTKYTAKDITEVLGSDALNIYKMLAQSSKGKVMIVPTGSGQASDKWTVKQPTMEAGVPLYIGLNSGTVWNSTSKILPTVDRTNPLYHLYVAVGSIQDYERVGQTNEYTGTIAAYSQPCGIAGSYCVMAPGGRDGDMVAGIYSTTDPTLMDDTDGYSYTYSYGTASAAAVVAGAVSLLMGAYPHLTSQQIVEILFKTATYITPTDTQISSYGNTYATGSDEYGGYNSIFGRGVINLAAATEPVGGKDGLWVYRTGTAIGQGRGVIKASATRLVSPASLTGASALSSALPSQFVAFDAYNRPFALPTAGLFNLKNRRKTKSWDDFKMFMRGRDPVEIQPTENFSMLYRNQTRRVSSSSQIPMGLVQMNLKHDKVRYSLFYSQDTTMGKEAYWKRRLSNPFIQMRDAYGVETGYDFNSKWSVEVGWTMGRNGFFDDDDRRFDTPDNKMQAFTSAVVFKPIDKLSFKVATGVMKETGSSLGMVSEGAFNIKGANTHFVGAGVVITPMDKIRLEAMYYYGQTKTSSSGGLMNLSRMTSDSFAVTASYQPTEDHLLGLQVSSPLRVRKGTMNVTLPVGRHPTKDIYYYDTYKADMKPKARELDLSMYYQGNVTDEVSVQSEMGVRLNPDHQADASPDYRGMVGVKWKY